MPATPSPSASKAQTSSPYPLVNVHETQVGGASESNGCATPHNTLSPLRYHYHTHSSSGGMTATTSASRPGCTTGHNSTNSIFNPPTMAMGGGATAAAGASHLHSFPSNELQEYISLTSPASDFYYYSPQPFYLESPVPCAAAELYGGGSPASGSFASSMAMGAMMGGNYGYGVDPTVAAAAAAANTPSLMSSMSMSGARLPQWYLPRGMCGPAVMPPGGLIPSTVLYGSGAPYGCGASTPVSMSMPPNSADEDVLSCEGGTSPLHPAYALPRPPRLSPQYMAAGMGHFALPPSVAGVERMSNAASVMAAYSAAASPVCSPTFRPQQPMPQFVPFDGRAYGLPMHPAMTPMESAAAAAVAAHYGPPATDGTGSGAASARRNGGGGVRGGAGKTTSSKAQPSSSSAAVAAKGVPPVEAKRDLAGESASSLATAESLTAEAREVYSPHEKALLADAHTRLARLRAKAQEEQQRERAAVAASASSRGSPGTTCPTSPTVTPTSADGNALQTVRQALSRKMSGAASQTVSHASSPPQRSTSAPSAHDDDAAVNADNEIPISPIARLSASDGADTAHLDDSMMDAMELSQKPGGDADTDADTRAVLERVLSVPGVKWRHDPYSRRVLAHHPTSQPGSDADEVSPHRSHASSASEPSSPPEALHSSGSTQAHITDVDTRKRTIAERSTATDPEHSATSPLASASTTANSQTRLSNRGDSVESGKAQQPSARRLPIKKVCVRHFVSGNGETTTSAEAAVGALLSVVSPAPAVSSPVAGVAVPRDATPSERSSSAGEERQASAKASPIPSEEPKDEPTEEVNTVAPVMKTRQPAGRRSTHVPQPRSQQEQRHRDVNEPPVQASVSPQHAVPTRSPFTTSTLTTTSTNTSTSTSTSSSSSSESSSEGKRVVYAPTSDPAVQCVSQQVPQASTTATFSTAVKVAPPTVSWALRARPPQVVEAPPLPVPMPVLTEEVQTLLLCAPVTSTADLDTRFLLRLWQQLDSTTCFRDVLLAREQKLGPDSNSSNRVVTRNGTRRFGGRQGGGSSDRADSTRATMLSEAEVTHVYVLHHRYRTSCAVASCRYEPGTEVVVDGDMGVDTGVVSLVVTKAEYNAMDVRGRSGAGFALQLEYALMASIHRPITAEELTLKSTVQTPLEVATLDFVRFLRTQSHLFHSCRIEFMVFVNVEFQADGQKLYVYYECTSPVRFLELAAYLNHIFHCRIWMKLARNYDVQPLQ